jgi:hypothetical protein
MITAKANEEAEEAVADANIRAERVSSCAIQVRNPSSPSLSDSAQQKLRAQLGPIHFEAA